MAQLLKDAKFHEYCKSLKVSGQNPSDPDRRCIEKAFRRLAPRIHPYKVRDPIEFKRLMTPIID